MTKNEIREAALVNKLTKAEESASRARGRRRLTGKRVQSVAEVKAGARVTAARRALDEFRASIA